MGVFIIIVLSLSHYGTSRILRLFARILGYGIHGALRYIAFEQGAFSLLDVIKTPALHPLPRRHLREIANQLVRGLECMCKVAYGETATAERSQFFTYVP